MSRFENLKIVVVAHYFPPINSSGAKRFQYMSKYWAAFGAEVTVITTVKSSGDGQFTEQVSSGINCYEFSPLGKLAESRETGDEFVPMHSSKPSVKRRFKDLVMAVLGQIPDPRIPFSLALGLRRLPFVVREKLENADVIVATSPPWAMLLAGLLLKVRYRKKLILDYRDNFSYCHEMPGGRFAKKFEYYIDRLLVKSADAVVTISAPMEQYYSKFGRPVFLVTNGYDFESIEAARLSHIKDQSKDYVTIRYMGIVSDGRIPRNFISALDELKAKEQINFSRLRVEFYGNASLLETFLTNYYPSLLSVFFFMIL